MGTYRRRRAACPHGPTYRTYRAPWQPRPKTASFSLREEDEAGEETKLGTVTIDLSAYASPETTTDPVELSFMQGKVLSPCSGLGLGVSRVRVRRAFDWVGVALTFTLTLTKVLLTLNLSSHWLKHAAAAADDDDASVRSMG